MGRGSILSKLNFALIFLVDGVLTEVLRHKCLAWTVEWIAGDGVKTVRNAIVDTCSISEAYDRSIPRSKDQSTSESAKEEREGQKNLNSPNNTKESGATDTPSEPAMAAGEPEDTKIHQASVPGSTKIPADTTTDEVEQPLKQSTTHRNLYFYLHRPRTATKKPVLAPLSPSSTLNEVLRGRTVLEFPTIHALPDSPETLAGQGTSPFILEEEYLRTAGPEEIGQSTASDEDDVSGNETLSGSAVNLQDVDEKRVLEVLKQDLFEEVPVTDPQV
jgi:hypothetical protein